MSETIDVVFSWDTTGSMYPAATQARRNIRATTDYLFDKVPDIRIGMIAHGDWCDRGLRQGELQQLDLTGDIKKIHNFIDSAPRTHGCNRGAIYERVMKDARSFSWTGGKNKALVMIGDTYPHTGGDVDFPGKCECRYTDDAHPQIDWRNELSLLGEAGIKVFPVRALASYNRDSTFFWEGVADAAATPLVQLEQFEDISDLIMAYGMNTAGKLNEFEAHLRARGNPSQGIEAALAKLSGRIFKRRHSSASAHFRAVAPDRFQVLSVYEDTPIKDFVIDNGLTFQIGRGFYEFTKRVLVQDYKEVIVQDRNTGDMFTGNDARQILGIPVGHGEKVKPGVLDKWRGFIQSTSPNRKLIAGTKFLYEADNA